MLYRGDSMFLSDIFNRNVILGVHCAVDCDMWIRTEGREEPDGPFKLGGTVRVRTWAGGGQQHDALQALYGLIAMKRGHEVQMSLAHKSTAAPSYESARHKRYITCDDNRGNYAELLHTNGLYGIRTINEENNWVGPVVWIKPAGNVPMTYEQMAFVDLFKSGFKQRPAYNLRVA